MFAKRDGFRLVSYMEYKRKFTIYYKSGKLLGWFVYPHYYAFDAVCVDGEKGEDPSDGLVSFGTKWEVIPGTVELIKAPWYKRLVYWSLVRPVQWVRYDLLGLWKEE